MKKQYKTPSLEVKVFPHNQVVACLSPGDIGGGGGEITTAPFSVDGVNNYDFEKEW